MQTQNHKHIETRPSSLISAGPLAVCPHRSARARRGKGLTKGVPPEQLGRAPAAVPLGLYHAEPRPGSAQFAEGGPGAGPEGVERVFGGGGDDGGGQDQGPRGGTAELAPGFDRVSSRQVATAGIGGK